MMGKNEPAYMENFKEDIKFAEDAEKNGNYMAASHLYHRIGDMLVFNYDDKFHAERYYKKAEECRKKAP